MKFSFTMLNLTITTNLNLLKLFSAYELTQKLDSQSLVCFLFFLKENDGLDIRTCIFTACSDKKRKNMNVLPLGIAHQIKMHHIFRSMRQV